MSSNKEDTDVEAVLGTDKNTYLKECEMIMLAVISSYFNPNRCHHRIENYRRFREELQKQSVPLYTFELAIGDQEYEIEPEDEHLIQARTDCLMFQKERTLNLLLEQLPPEYNNVCWMDCDIVFMREDWAEATEEQLKKFNVVQPYSWAVSMTDCKWERVGASHVHAHECFGSSTLRRGFGYYMSQRKRYISFHEGHVGYVWAANRDFLDKHKFYDSVITGAGDLFMCMAAVGQFGFIDAEKSLANMSQETANHFYDWGSEVVKDTEGEIGFTEGLIMHLWHGDLNKRNYLLHSQCIGHTDFHPEKDLRLDKNNLWEWKRENKPLHDFVKSIFDKQKTA